MVLEEPALRKLVFDNKELLSNGVLLLDLRNSARSFSELVDQKYGKSPSDDLVGPLNFSITLAVTFCTSTPTSRQMHTKDT